MSARVLGSSILRWARRWGVPMALLTAANAALWWGMIRPHCTQMRRWRQAGHILQARPDLEAMLQHSDETVSAWHRGYFSSNNPQAAIQLLQQSATRHHVQLSGLNLHAVRDAAAPIELDAAGTFSQLANWIGELETVSGLQLEQWSVAAGSELGQPHHAKLSLSALMSHS